MTYHPLLRAGEAERSGLGNHFRSYGKEKRVIKSGSRARGRPVHQEQRQRTGDQHRGPGSARAGSNEREREAPESRREEETGAEEDGQGNKGESGDLIHGRYRVAGLFHFRATA